MTITLIAFFMAGTALGVLFAKVQKLQKQLTELEKHDELGMARVDWRTDGGWEPENVVIEYRRR